MAILSVRTKLMALILWRHTLKEVRLALAIFADDNVDVGGKVVEKQGFIGFEVFESD